MSESKVQPIEPPWISHFFAIIPDASGERLLLLPTPQGWALPSIRTEAGIWVSESERIAAALRAGLGLDFDFTTLRYISREEDQAARWDRTLFVLEPAAPLAAPPLDGQWVDRARLADLPLAQPQQRVPLLRYLAENGSDAALDPRRPPWAQPGWYTAAAAWVEATIAGLGMTQTGPVEQLRTWSISSLLAAPTSAGRVYFKAAADLPLFVHEPALVERLARLYPGHVPTPLAVDRPRRWMLMEDFGPPLEAQTGQYALPEPALAAYGALQRDSADHLDALALAGCMDRRPAVLATQIDPLIADPLTQTVLTPEEYAELAAYAPRLKARCAEMEDCPLPMTLVHGDLHGSNVARRNGGYLFFDWTDACISLPFFDHFQVYFADTEDEQVRGREAYLAVWQEVVPLARLRDLWTLARPLCALHHSVSYRTIVHAIEPLVREELLHGLPDFLRRVLVAMRDEAAD